MYQPTTLYPVKIFFKNEGEIRLFVKNVNAQGIYCK